MRCGPSWFRHDVAPFWRAYVTVLVPVLLSPLPLVVNTEEAWCGYAILIMAAYWVTEAVPMAVTALLPTVLFPLFGILDTGEVSMQYLTSTNLLFLAGLMVAVAVEKSNFHTRAALSVVLLVGSSIRWLMLGFMFVTMFFSMWMSNTPTTAMITPMINATIIGLTQDLDDPEEQERAENGEAGHNDMPVSTEALDSKSKAQPLTAEQLRAPLYLCVAYAANCGGMGTITGTAPNLVFQGIIEQYYGTDTGLSFATWMLMGIPCMLLCTAFGWMLLICLFLGPQYLIGDPTPPERLAAVRRSLQRRHAALGPMRFHERAVLALLSLVILLWFFRAPGFMSGWGELFTQTKIGDGTAGMLVVIIMFMIPAKPRFWCFKEKGKSAETSEGLLVWSDIHKNLPWGILLLLGGGFALAAAAIKSNLSAWLAQQLTVLNSLPAGLVVFIVCLSTTLATEIASNTAISTILMPVMAQLSVSLRLNPMYLMLPMTLSCSFAFMLPVATPPNAIVFGAGNLRSQDMIKAGICMNIICVAVNMLLTHTLAVAVFDVLSFPDWANTTSAADPAYVALRLLRTI